MTAKVTPGSKAPTRGSKPGEYRGGRKKGTPNKTTAKVKEAVEAVFEGLGGVPALQRWVQADPDNAKTFYGSIWPKLLPVQLSGEGGGPIKLESKVNVAGLNDDQLRALASIKI